MTIDIASPDGEMLAFDTEAEVYAYIGTQPQPWLMRPAEEFWSEVMALQEQAERALAQRRGRGSRATPCSHP
jgi:hypothetical protein